MQYVPRTVTRSSQMQRDDDASRCGIRSRRSRWMRWDEDASWCRHLLSRRSDAVKWSGAQVRSRDLQFLSRQARQSHSINLVTLILTAWPSTLLQPLIIIIIIKVVLRLESALIEMFWSFFLPTLHYKLRAIRGGPIGLVNFTPHFIVIQIFQILFYRLCHFIRTQIFQIYL